MAKRDLLDIGLPEVCTSVNRELMQKEKRPTKEQKRPAYRAYLTVLAITLQSIAKRDLLSHMTCVLLLTYLQCIPDSAGRYPAAIRSGCHMRRRIHVI
jgi:hypothetical protein